MVVLDPKVAVPDVLVVGALILVPEDPEIVAVGILVLDVDAVVVVGDVENPKL